LTAEEERAQRGDIALVIDRVAQMKTGFSVILVKQNGVPTILCTTTADIEEFSVGRTPIVFTKVRFWGGGTGYRSPCGGV
jgi:hypothetical protein